ncbi:pyridoxamine 5'-phosphate oxidase family protein [Roseinatronobacter alkalisoli]|uniref:Pyridoxamine 5'-phosphate oxidase family protein n=1 Tax=Roseinatronobacter alkalisoli TaxID=3028235 RepID=A0ABT5T8R1_9RHOB|nr:pyridoxamine 5'-phosphate oxidase family protein [Roseinatronobacter sp. HJB301]MDD7971519.1 pyridoxamine 5'-phosphate oxidase family protein [Roseinatronobacter sp. HJB301]
MEYIQSVAELESHYGQPAPASLLKVTDKITPAYRAWIARARFCVLSTVGPDGVDASPRGDDAAVVHIQDERTLLLPDWHGNNRIDSLRNIVADGRASLMFVVAGAQNVIRANGHARLTTDAPLRASFERQGKHPRSVIEFRLSAIYFQCARALMRARLWSDGDQSHGLPSMGDILSELGRDEFDGTSYDRMWPERARQTMW